MQSIIASIFSIIFTGLFFFGCASDPVPTYLPLSNPAHPEASEVVYTAPPNPFKDGMQTNRIPSDESPKSSTEPHGESHSHRMKSGGKKHEKFGGKDTEKAGHHHKEHE